MVYAPIYIISNYTFSDTTPNGYIEASYSSYSTIKECGVYMYNGGTSFPIFSTIPSYINFFNGIPANASSIATTSGVGGSGGYGLYQRLDIADIDDNYLIHPGYGIIVYDGLNFTGSQKNNYENTTNQINFVSSTSGNNNKGASCKVYYKGVLLI